MQLSMEGSGQLHVSVYQAGRVLAREREHPWRKDTETSTGSTLVAGPLFGAWICIVFYIELLFLGL